MVDDDDDDDDNDDDDLGCRFGMNGPMFHF